MALKLYDKLTPSGDFPLVSATDVEMPDGSRLSEFPPGIDENTAERISNLEAQAESAAENLLNNSLRLNALETPAASVDMSAFDATGVITETHKNGYTSTYTLTFDGNGNPTQIVEVRKNADGQSAGEFTTVLTW